MEQFRLYLRAELAKLRNAGDASAFLSRSACRPAPTVEAIVDLFASQARVDAYVSTLDDRALLALTDCCATWRKNGVAARLRQGSLSRIVEVPVSVVLLRQAELELRPAFERNAWRLDAIAKDPEVLAAEPYCGHAPGEAVEFRTCLSDPPKGGLYRLFDGMHRAVQMGRNGEATISVGVVVAKRSLHGSSSDG